MSDGSLAADTACCDVVEYVIALTANSFTCRFVTYPGDMSNPCINPGCTGGVGPLPGANGDISASGMPQTGYEGPGPSNTTCYNAPMIWLNSGIQTTAQTFIMNVSSVGTSMHEPVWVDLSVVSLGTANISSVLVEYRDNNAANPQWVLWPTSGPPPSIGCAGAMYRIRTYAPANYDIRVTVTP